MPQMQAVQGKVHAKGPQLQGNDSRQEALDAEAVAGFRAQRRIAGTLDFPRLMDQRGSNLGQAA